MVTGQFDSDNSVIHLGEEARRYLFVQEKGDLDLPEFGYYFFLSDLDAKKLGQPYIGVILLNELNEQDIASNYDKAKIHLELIPMAGDKPMYYSKNINYFNLSNHLSKETKVLPRTDFRKNFFINPSLKDTISWSEVTTYQYLRHTKEWIAKLNSQQKVIVEYTGYAERTDGSEMTILNYEAETMSKLARQQLHYVENLMAPLSPPSSDSGTQIQWQKWFNSTIAFNNKVTSCNTRNWNIELTYRDFGIFNSDPFSNMAYRIEQVPGYTDYSDQQVVAFDLKNTKSFRRNIYSESQQQANSAELFECINDTIYLVNQYFMWSKFKLGADKGSERRAYEFLQAQSILPPTMLSKGQRYYFDQSYSTADYMFLVVHEEKTGAVFLISLETKTGKMMGIVPLDDIMGKSKLSYSGSLVVNRMSYGNKHHNDFVIAIKNESKQFILKLNAKLDLIAMAQMAFVNEAITVIQKEKMTLFVSSTNYAIRTMVLDEQLNLVNSKLDILPDGYSESALFSEDGENVRVIMKYDDAFFSGIKSAIINKDFEISATKCVYSYAPMEEKSDENTINLQYLTKANGKWFVFFKMENQLNFAEIN
jgi:hypothetical protein